MEYTITANNIHVFDSYKTTNRKIIKGFLETLKVLYPKCTIFRRSVGSLVREWCGHNLLYEMNFQRARTKDVDLDYPIRWYMEVGYWFLNLIYVIKPERKA